MFLRKQLPWEILCDRPRHVSEEFFSVGVCPLGTLVYIMDVRMDSGVRAGLDSCPYTKWTLGLPDEGCDRLSAAKLSHRETVLLGSRSSIKGRDSSNRSDRPTAVLSAILTDILHIACLVTAWMFDCSCRIYHLASVDASNGLFAYLRAWFVLLGNGGTCFFP